MSGAVCLRKKKGGRRVHFPFDTDFSDLGFLGTTWSNPDSKITISSVLSVFGGKSARRSVQDSTSGLVSSANPIDYTKNCTVHFWSIALSSSGDRLMVQSMNGSTIQGLQIGCSSSGLVFARIFAGTTNSSIVQQGSIGIEGGSTPHHVAVTHISSEKKLLLHIDGIYIGKTATAWAGTCSPTLMDILGDGNNQTIETAVAMYMDNFVIEDSAIYGEVNFTPPTTP